MPVFKFNKLVRDKLPEIYESLRERIVSRNLGGTDLLSALADKDVEETLELKACIGNKEKMIDELADKRQIQLDFATIAGVTEEEIEARRQTKFQKKGGFADGVFVETIELEDGDEWIEYYRKEPEKYKEL